MRTKEKIIAKISSIDDENYLNHILDMLSAVEESEMVYSLSDTERKEVDESLKDVEEGRVYSQSEVNEMTDKWLKGK